MQNCALSSRIYELPQRNNMRRRKNIFSLYDHYQEKYIYNILSFIGFELKINNLPKVVLPCYVQFRTLIKSL